MSETPGRPPDRLPAHESPGVDVVSRDRRTFLAGLGVVGSSLLAGCGDLFRGSARTPTPEPTTTPTEAPQETPTDGPSTDGGTPTEEPLQEVTITEFGAKVDGTTDDTAAFREALEAVEPGGTVIVPEGDVVVRADAKTSTAIDIQRPLRGVTIRGVATDGPPKSRIVMGGGHPHNHKAIQIRKAEGDGKESGGNFTIRDLVFDGNWSEQVGGDGTFPNGFGVDVRGTGQGVLFENCIFQNWATNGGIMEAENLTVRNCTFHHNGYGAASVGRDGHGMNAGAGSDGVLVENCLFTDHSGAGVDSRRGKVTVRNAVFVGNQFGVKLNDATREVVLENCALDMQGGGEQCIYSIPNRDDVGTLRLERVHIANARWPGIDLPSKARVVGTDILLTNCNRSEVRRGALYLNGGSEVDIERLSVHETPGGAVQFRNASGRIGTLVHSGNDDGVGVLSRVELGRSILSIPISLDIPDASSVGAGLGSVRDS